MSDAHRLGETSAGSIFDRVSWEFDPEGEQPSPLVTTRRYFEDFPWESEEPEPEKLQPVDGDG